MSMKVIAKLLFLLAAIATVLFIANFGGVIAAALFVAVFGCFAMLHWRAEVQKFHCMWWGALANARRHRCNR